MSERSVSSVINSTPPVSNPKETGKENLSKTTTTTQQRPQLVHSLSSITSKDLPKLNELKEKNAELELVV